MSLLKKMSINPKEFEKGLPLTSYESKRINKVILKKVLNFGIGTIIVIIIAVIRYLSYKHDLTYHFFLMDFFAYRHSYMLKIMIGLYLIMLFKFFGRYIYDLLFQSQFNTTNIEVIKYDESLKTKLLSDYKHYAWVKYNDKVTKVGVDNDLWDTKDINAKLILRGKIPYCIVKDKEE